MSERWFDHWISVRSERVKALQVWGFNERQARFLVVEASPGRDDNGLLKFSDGAFVWQHSEEGWTDIVEKLGAMGTRAGHQYLDGPGMTCK